MTTATQLFMGDAEHQLRAFQKADETWMQTHPKNMLLYDRGLGKTVVATMRNINAGVGTHLVFCPKNASNTWKDHAEDWIRHYYPYDDVDVFLVRGKPADRKKLWDELLRPERTRQKRVFISTYGSALRDIPLLTDRHWKNADQIDFDEAHRMRSRKSLLYKKFGPILRKHPNFSFLTSTPISRGAEEFFVFLNCIDPRGYSSYWKHVGMFCEVIDGYWGKEIIGQRNIEAFHMELRRFARIRSAEDPDIAGQMPEMTRTSIPVELDLKQSQIYAALEMDKLYWTDDGKAVVASGSMELWMKLRQLLVCPQILDAEASLGGAFTDYLEMMEEASPQEQHNVIFTPFKRAFIPFRKELERRKYHVSQLSGGITAEEQANQIALWRRHHGVMMCTIPYAESFSLEPARDAYFLGYEWDPNQNRQAEGRLRRLTTKYPINANYYRYANTIENGMADRVNWKMRQISTHMVSTGEQQS